MGSLIRFSIASPAPGSRRTGLFECPVAYVSNLSKQPIILRPGTDFGTGTAVAHRMPATNLLRTAPAYPVEIGPQCGAGFRHFDFQIGPRNDQLDLPVLLSFENGTAPGAVENFRLLVVAVEDEVIRVREEIAAKEKAREGAESVFEK